MSASEALDGGRAEEKQEGPSLTRHCGQPSARPVCPPLLCVPASDDSLSWGPPFVQATFRRSCVTGQQRGHDL